MNSHKLEIATSMTALMEGMSLSSYDRGFDVACVFGCTYRMPYVVSYVVSYGGEHITSAQRE